MTDDKFMLVSLKEDQAKKVAQVLANPTSTKILDELTRGEKTESQLSKKLKIPISTVHYNLQQLQKAKLVLVEEFHYSEKGREVNHYKLANKYIIIAPQEEKESMLSKLKGLLPITLFTVGGALALKFAQMFAKATNSASPVADSVVAPTVETIAEDSAVPVVQKVTENIATDATMQYLRTEGSTAGAVRSMEATSAVVNETVNQTFQVVKTNATATTTVPIQPVSDVIQAVPWWQSPMIDWAILGAFTVLFLLVAIEIVRSRKR